MQSVFSLFPLFFQIGGIFGGATTPAADTGIVSAMEAFDRKSLPEYITNALKEIGNGHLNQF